MKQSKFQGIYERKGRRKTLLTRNLTPGKTFFEEKLVHEGKIEYREWDPRRSKLAAFILKGGNQIGIKEGCKVLYLGASYGYTPTFVSDIVWKGGMVFALDFAPRVMRNLVFVCEARKNMAPLFFDANHPEEYKDKIIPPVDIVYMDVAQRDQAGIFLKNVDMFLKPGGFCLLALKARSVDVTKKPGVVFKEVRRKLEEKLIVVDYKTLEPFELDHAMFVCKKK
ncbi:fibrillarin-like rRNA/tRNA 2'-O-methyltransferase [Candidatus Woesearchaeota archaeon]|nr:fibrillarin-like rRNA/tRNA 2'-O-methyltransferase [Candidatus Woesearchaeota archaeon]